MEQKNSRQKKISFSLKGLIGLVILLNIVFFGYYQYYQYKKFKLLQEVLSQHHKQYSIAELRTLSTLDLSGTHGVSRILYYLEPLTNLKTLDLSYTKINDLSLSHLNILKKLVRLKLEGTNICVLGLEELKTLPNLKELDLAYRHRTSTETVSRGSTSTFVKSLGFQGMNVLKELKGLTYLNLSQQFLGDADIVPLGELKKLKLLDLSGCDRITKKGILLLQKKLPHCKIIHEKAKP